MSEEKQEYKKGCLEDARKISISDIDLAFDWFDKWFAPYSGSYKLNRENTENIELVTKELIKAQNEL